MPCVCRMCFLCVVTSGSLAALDSRPETGVPTRAAQATTQAATPPEPRKNCAGSGRHEQIPAVRARAVRWRGEEEITTMLPQNINFNVVRTYATISCGSELIEFVRAS